MAYSRGQNFSPYEEHKQRRNPRIIQQDSDGELVQGEQGLLLFTPNLQSFGALPKEGSDIDSQIM